jgi:hypothetical protein
MWLGLRMRVVRERGSGCVQTPRNCHKVYETGLEKLAGHGYGFRRSYMLENNWAMVSIGRKSRPSIFGSWMNPYFL